MCKNDVEDTFNNKTTQYKYHISIVMNDEVCKLLVDVNKMEKELYEKIETIEELKYKISKKKKEIYLKCNHIFERDYEESSDSLFKNKCTICGLGNNYIC